MIQTGGENQSRETIPPFFSPKISEIHMPAKNLCHDIVIQALVADGWLITDDPLTITYGGKDLFVDIGAERMAIAAERGTHDEVLAPARHFPPSVWP